MLQSINNLMSGLRKNRLYNSARVVFLMQKYFDQNFGKKSLAVKNYRSGTLTVEVDRYLIDEYQNRREIINELKKTTRRERVSISWKGK